VPSSRSVSRPIPQCPVESLDENGEPVTLITLFPREKAEIIDNWDTLGMRGTGSHDVNVDDVFVPAERAVPFKPLEQPSPAYSGPWHRLTIWPPVILSVLFSLAGFRSCACVPSRCITRLTNDHAVMCRGTRRGRTLSDRV
jgi:indole-3-acetate monooxygenase